MASYKDYKSISAARKAGSMYYTDKNGKKALAVTKETLDAWKKKNKGKFKGSALTAWANAKGKNIGASAGTAPPKKPSVPGGAGTAPPKKPSVPGAKRPPKRPVDPRSQRPKQPKGAPTLRERNPVETDYLLPGTDKTLKDVFTKAEIDAASKRARKQLGTDAKPYTKPVPGKAIYDAIKERTSVSEIKARAKRESEKRSRYKRGAGAG